MARTATRTATVFTRVDPETKEQAEAILNQLGIPMSNAIGMFLKQIVMQHGIPFEMKLPASVPAAIGSMTKEQFDMELQNSSVLSDLKFPVDYFFPLCIIGSRESLLPYFFI